MAKNLSTLYPGKIDIDANNPNGTFKNRTSDALKDGTPYEKGWSSDVWGFLAHILKKAVISPSGAEENQTNSQYYDALDGLLGRRNVEFETSRDLVFNVVSSKNVQATFSRMSLLDSNFIPKYLNDQDITWDIEAVGVLEAGTSEKASTNYGAWVDSDGVIKLVPDLVSVTDSTTAFKLKDSAATLLTDLVHAGDIAFNLTDLTQTTVSVDASAEGEVSVTDDIFVSGDDYKIVKMSPLGLGANRERLATAFNNSGSDFDDSWYTQIQEEKFYTNTAGDFDITSASWTTTYGLISVRQINDWTGLGIWKMNLNIGGTTAAPVASIDITISGMTFKAGINQGVFQSRTSTVASLLRSFTTGPSISMNITVATSEFLYSGDVEANKKPSFHN